MDNLTLFSNRSSELRRQVDAVRGFLRDKLKLSLREGRVSYHDCRQALTYLGYNVSRERREPGPRLLYRLVCSLVRSARSRDPHARKRALRSMDSYRGFLMF